MVYGPSAGSVQLYVHVTFVPGQPVHAADCHAPPLIDTSTPFTAILSDAVPSMVYGSGVLLFKTAPFEGFDINDVGFVSSAVVYEKE
jgi:hypothetical protein